LQVWSTTALMSECVNTFLLALFVYVLVRLMQTSDPPLLAFVGLGAVLAAATFVRPVTYYFPLLLVVVLAVVTIRRRPGSTQTRVLRAVAVCAAFLLPIVVSFGWWQYRNHEQVDSWRFTGIEGYNLYFYAGAGALAEDRGRSPDSVRDQLRDERPPRPDESIGEFYEHVGSEGQQILREHPIATVRSTGKALVSTTLGINYTFFTTVDMTDPPTGAIVLLAKGLLVAFYLLAAGGVVQAFRAHRYRIEHAVIVVFIAYVVFASSFSAGPFTYSRLRAVVMPLLAVYAAKCLVDMWRWAERKRRGTVAQPDPELAPTA
jgi:4-amino-4-deoxy-L-arabinose transferase-like glycosyltransferase